MKSTTAGIVASSGSHEIMHCRRKHAIGSVLSHGNLRRAMALSLDRKGFIDILSEGQNKIGGAMMPPPEGVWGMPPDMLKTLPGYDPDVPKNRAQARKIMEQLGYGPDNRLKVKVAAR